jgi:hypothetical protein
VGCRWLLGTAHKSEQRSSPFVINKEKLGDE